MPDTTNELQHIIEQVESITEELRKEVANARAILHNLRELKMQIRVDEEELERRIKVVLVREIGQIIAREKAKKEGTSNG